ncbi:Proline dehydrogenase 1, mitochondrial [Labeo rohita]|uniref:Proline dehydrogenase n=2 Tax=Labeonini TaxID=2743697 RepID=A0ABQ8MQ46_LABRO|nr:Proline dehydrogenase 1, mitochondrial [Labeo rohita]
MSIRKTLPAFGLATFDRNIRSFVISTRHRRNVQALHSTKTNTNEEASDSRQHVSFSNKISIDFEQTKEAYKSKDTLELLRSLVVFKLCSYDILVDNNKEKTFEQFMKMTFYGQFVAGEDHQSIRPVVQKNQAFGVGAVLDYSVEEDLSQEEAERKEMEASAPINIALTSTPMDPLQAEALTAHFKSGKARVCPLMTPSTSQHSFLLEHYRRQNIVSTEPPHAANPRLWGWMRKSRGVGVSAVRRMWRSQELNLNKSVPRVAVSCMSTLEKESPGADHRETFTARRKFGNRHEAVTSARTYFYADEAKCDQHMETFLKCIKASGGSSEDGFSAIKMTALGRPQFLLQFSEVLVKWRRFFSFLAAKQGKDGVEVLEQKLDQEQLQTCLASLGAQGNIQSCFSDGRLHSSGVVDILDWNRLIDERMKISDLLVVPNLQTGRLEPLLSKFTEEEERQLKRMLQRLDILAKHAVENGVRLMVDAEQTYFQPAISRLTVEMKRIFNRDKAVVFNTYQCYLKEAFDNVSMDVELSRREGWCFGAKLIFSKAFVFGGQQSCWLKVRTKSRMIYEQLVSFRCLDYILEEIEQNKKANVMVASHNLDTVKHTLRRMNEMGLAPTDKKVYFGQLLGMCDQISFPLAQAGFPVYKYVPYGPVNEVIPYLSRRAQENRGIMKGVQMERELLWKELMRRLTSGEVFYTPAV